MRAFALLFLLLAAGCNKDTETAAGTDGDGDGYTSDVDCADDDPNVHPDATEVCNDKDDDCDGGVDNGVGSTFFVDADLDGYGDANSKTTACKAGPGVVNNSVDCDDTDADVNPYAEEVCDGKDNDCNDKVDDGVTEVLYTDADGDGYGDPKATVDGCGPTDGIVDNSLDCDDGDAEINPDADEVCDGEDNDCDKLVDENDALDARTWYADTDGDGYGDTNNVTLACDMPAGYVGNDKDCDDDHSKALPGGTEVCDDLDNDCDGTVDENDATDAKTWYTDVDGDGYGDSSLTTTVACESPGAGWAAKSGDCDESDAAISPAGIETCDGVDQDCDGTVDDSPTDGTTYYADTDGDGYGSKTVSKKACSQPSGYVTVNTDCNDADSAISPAATEVCDGKDNDCDGTSDESDAADATTYYKDADGDGYGTTSTTTRSCTKVTGYVTDGTDCDDSAKSVHPGASETCNAVDDDCNGSVDDNPVSGGVTHYKDADGDGYGVSTTTATYCKGYAPAGWVTTSGDCDDTDATLNPGTIWYYDADLDGYGSTSYTYTSCTDPGTYYVRDSTDCDDYNSKTYPGATEVCVSGTSAEGKDNDCDGSIDEGCPTIHCGTISKDETWDSSNTQLVTCDVYVQDSTYGPTLTIEDGTTVQFSSNANIYVGSSYRGDIDIQGTSTGVTFTSSKSSPAAGDWGTLAIFSNSTGSKIDGLTATYGGGNTSYPGELTVYGNYSTAPTPTVTNSTFTASKNYGVYTYYAKPTITDTTISDNGSTGLYCGYEPCIDRTDDSFQYNTITGNKGYPIRVYAADVDALDDTSTYSGNTTDQIWVYNGIISSDAEWQDLDASYFLDNMINVYDSKNNPTLTIDDGVTILADSTSGLSIASTSYGYSGNLVVNGTSKGVTMTSVKSTPAKGDWYGIRLWSYSSSTTVIDGLDLSYAGGDSSYPADLYSYYGSPTITNSSFTQSKGDGLRSYYSQIDVSDSSFSNNATYGVNMQNSGGLAAPFSGNTVTGNAGAPMSVPWSSIGQVDASSSYSGNTSDYLEVTYDQSIQADATWQTLDVPYHVMNNLYVAASTAPIVTIEDGNTIYWGASTGLWVGWSGSTNPGGLVIDGSSPTGVQLLSYTGGGPGSWYGILLGTYTSSLTTLTGFTLDDAGGYSSYYGGLYLYYGATADVSNCVISDSKYYGIYDYAATLGLTDCTIKGTKTSSTSTYPDGDGVYITGGSTGSPAPSITAWSGNTITSNNRYPVNLPANLMAALDTTSAYSGNTKAYVYVQGDYVIQSGTWSALDQPYLIGGNVYIQQNGSTGSLPEITTSGATYYFSPGIGLYVGSGYYGDLYADSCTFTSSRTTRSAGDWYGIYVGQYASSGTYVKNSEISYGGSSNGNIYLYYTKAGTYTGNTISYSSKYGIYRYGSTTATITPNTFVSNTSGDYY